MSIVYSNADRKHLFGEALFIDV